MPLQVEPDRIAERDPQIEPADDARHAQRDQCIGVVRTADGGVARGVGRAGHHRHGGGDGVDADHHVSGAAPIGVVFAAGVPDVVGDVVPRPVPQVGELHVAIHQLAVEGQDAVRIDRPQGPPVLDRFGGEGDADDLPGLAMALDAPFAVLELLVADVGLEELLGEADVGVLDRFRKRRPLDLDRLSVADSGYQRVVERG